jgi:prolipoprotein diacylglyceryltransferase
VRRWFIEQLYPYLGESAAWLMPGYLIMSTLGMLCGVLLMRRLLRARGYDPRLALEVGVVVLGAALLGGVLFPTLFHGLDELVRHGHVCVHIVGMTSWGGFAAGTLALWFLIRADGTMSFRRFMDLFAAPAGLGLAFTRIGCFLGGCDYGQVTSSWLGMRFPTGSPAFKHHVAAGWVPPHRVESLPVHPTQLYEAAAGLLILVVALVLLPAMERRRERFAHGSCFFVVAMIYAASRFGIEALRGDDARGLWGGSVSTGQLWAIGLLVLVAFAWWRATRADQLAPS